MSNRHPADPVRAFRVEGDGYVEAVDPAARQVSETVAYLARLGAAVSELLGAGDLRAIEVMGPASVYAELRHSPIEGPTISGLLDRLGSSPESLRDRLHGRLQ